MPWRDGQGRRLRIKDPNVEVFYQYGMGQVISDRDGAGAVIAYYVRGLGGRLISNVQTAGTRYYHFDGLGSVVALTDSAGAKVSSYTYDEFGVLKQSTGQSWNNFEYTSSIHDASPGLYLMGSRYYDPALGRFITQDTWGGNVYDPWTKNLYAYGRGNPVTYIDPTGHGGVLSNGVYVECSLADFTLLEFKIEYANACSPEERALVASQAEEYRKNNPGYTVQPDKSLADYLALYSSGPTSQIRAPVDDTGTTTYEGLQTQVTGSDFYECDSQDLQVLIGATLVLIAVVTTGGIILYALVPAAGVASFIGGASVLSGGLVVASAGVSTVRYASGDITNRQYLTAMACDVLGLGMGSLVRPLAGYWGAVAAGAANYASYFYTYYSTWGPGSR